MQMTARTKDEVVHIKDELERQKKAKRDYIVPTKDLRAAHMVTETIDGDGNPHVTDEFLVRVDMGQPVGNATFNVGPIAHQQLADRLGITAPYYRRMQTEAQDLLAININHWLGQTSKNYMVRTLDGIARAILSDRYRRLDNVDLFFHTVETAMELQAEIQRIDLTDERFYVRIIHPEWRERLDQQKQHGVGSDLVRPTPLVDSAVSAAAGTNGELADWAIPLCIVSNSEVGRGGLKVERGLFRLRCLNGLVVDSTRQIHLGGEQDEGLLSAETLDKKDEVFWLEIRDLVRATFDREKFHTLVETFGKTQELMIANPVDAAEAMAVKSGMTDDRKQTLINEFLFGGDRTVFGLVNALTATARETDDPNEAIELERFAGQVMQNVPAEVSVVRN